MKQASGLTEVFKRAEGLEIQGQVLWLIPQLTSARTNFRV